jgi:tetratricopeptide (TPR) repeat protein
MDRKVAIAGGTIVAMISLWIGRRAQPEPPAQPTSSQTSAEPARLDLTGVTIKPVSRPVNDHVLPTAFPFFASGKSKGVVGQADLITPEMATPTLAIPKEPVIELPSATATPAPVERVPVTTESRPAIESTPAFPRAPIAPPKPAVPLRPAALTSAVTRAEQMTAEGLGLAQRGAIFSARSQFMRALRQIANAQDEVNSTTRFTRSLNAALKAMEESQDFDVRHATNSDRIDVARVVAGHRTEVLKLENLSNTNPGTARDRYQVYAVEQLTAALGNDQAGSMPLYGLGRISAASGKANATGDVYGAADALIWYHAALMTDASNFRAAHELGSVYAKRGEWERARAVMQRAVAVQPHPTTWANLAIVHSKLGEHDWATAAQARARNATPPAATGNLPPIDWIDAETFAKSTAPNEVFFPQQTKPPVAAQSPAQREPRSAAKPKSAIPWLPWGSSQRR